MVEVVDLTGDTDDDGVVAAAPPPPKRARGEPAGGAAEDDVLLCDAPELAMRDADAEGEEEEGDDDDVRVVGVTGEVRTGETGGRCGRETGTCVLEGHNGGSGSRPVPHTPQIPLADYPHPRHECVNYDFALTPHSQFCAKVRCAFGLSPSVAHVSLSAPSPQPAVPLLRV
jgi:hypothetical protein